MTASPKVEQVDRVPEEAVVEEKEDTEVGKRNGTRERVVEKFMWDQRR